MSVAMVQVGPGVQTMEDGLLESQGVILTQKNSECCRFCCCQPQMDFTTHDYAEEWSQRDESAAKSTILENASWFGRCMSFCMPGSRETTWTQYKGTVDRQGDQLVTPDGSKPEVLMTHSKPRTNGVNVFLCQGDGGQLRVPCCCDLPYLETKDPSGRTMGTTRYICDKCLWVPKFSVENGQGQEVYRLRPDTCCLGCCVRCRCGGKGGKCCRVPILLRDPITHEPVQQTMEGKTAPGIVDLWAGFKRECCTRRNVYQVKYPTDIDDDMKATLVGAALLVDLTLFEQDQS
jgi:hypothetical protein